MISSCSQLWWLW